MADLYLHNSKVETIFELLGSDENDITYSIGWALSQSPEFLQALVKRVLPDLKKTDIHQVRLQDYHENHGITDIEIIGSDVHVIFEAKRGWAFPSQDQLDKYANRLRSSQFQHRLLVVMAESSHEYAEKHLPKKAGEFPISYLNWKDIEGLSRISRGSHVEKRLLCELRVYLRRIINMQNHLSNMVYVLSLGADTPNWSKISWRDIVNKKHHYFHPFDKHWPKAPPNYLGFRYDGKLQSIHHVDSWKLVEEMHTDIPEIDPGDWGPFVLYTLGPAIIPSSEVKSGRIMRSMRVWAMLDLLLTSKTISEARDLTQKRLREERP